VRKAQPGRQVAGLLAASISAIPPAASGKFAGQNFAGVLAFASLHGGNTPWQRQRRYSHTTVRWVSLGLGGLHDIPAAKNDYICHNSSEVLFFSPVFGGMGRPAALLSPRSALMWRTPPKPPEPFVPKCVAYCFRI